MTWGKAKWVAFGGLALCLALTLGFAQQPDSQTPDAQKEEIPDAPSTTRPPQNFPDTPPAPKPEPAPQPRPQPSLPASQLPPREGQSAQPPPPTPTSTGSGIPAPPPLKITTVSPGGETDERTATAEDLYKISVSTNQVLVPVMVKDEAGHLLNGLLPRDFSVFEDGKKQTLNFFTADSFALSAAVIIDQSMPDVALQKVNQTFSALQGAFSQYDEVAVYSYSSSVSRVADFTAASKRLADTFNDLKTVTGRNNGVPVMSGPLGPQGPTVNGLPIDQGTIPAISPPRESHVLNDAVLAAAVDLSKRDRSRRKVIFVISDGREARSKASYQDVLKVLLTNGIIVYGVSVEGSAIPVYEKLQRMHLPKTPYSDILPKYAGATGGEITTGFSREAMENAYSNALGDARNQYTLGYVTRATPSTAYRDVEVTVARPSCKRSSARPCVDVIAKNGYYPAGSRR
jgi:VWFA-related protein